jgi:hypothetical protein
MVVFLRLGRYRMLEAGKPGEVLARSVAYCSGGGGSSLGRGQRGRGGGAVGEHARGARAGASSALGVLPCSAAARSGGSPSVRRTSRARAMTATSP